MERLDFMKRSFSILLAVGLYVLLCYIPGLNIIAKPIELLCTYLHEFGHAFFSLISGGHVHSLCVNMDGSGVTTTSGGSRGLCTMGGYVGSAVFGNIMLRMNSDTRASIALKLLSGVMLISSLFWFDNLITSGVILLFAVSLFLLSKTKLRSFAMSFLGIACIVYIIQDFNVGPTSDLQAYEHEVGFFPAEVWMYLWLFIVLVMTGINLLKMKN
jgi:hypothetical protein